MINNTDRVLNAAQALHAYRLSNPEAHMTSDPQELLTDLLADLMHNADSQKLKFGDALRMAQLHHGTERS